MANKTKAVNPQLQKPLYYPALDGLRFFAFLLVFLHHSLYNLQSNNFIINFFLIGVQKNGWVGVDLFFALSGFLITTLLLRERRQYGHFSIKNFWIRRSLRIWPLYYLALIVGFFIFPTFAHTFNSQEMLNEIFYYLFFLGNWSIFFHGYSKFIDISHLWTISLEEQFYFLWPLILIFITSFRKTIITGIVILLISALTRLYLAQINIQHPGIYVNTFARIDILTLGAIIALIYYYQPKIISNLKIILNLKFQILVLGLMFYLMYRIFLFDPAFKVNVVFGYLLFGLIFSYLVISIIETKSLLTKTFSIKPFVFLGKISYGLYIWHILALELAFQFSDKMHLQLLGPVFGFLLTMILALVSYYSFELFFLRFKSKFTKVKSRPL